jgi:hypothetical protein
MEVTVFWVVAPCSLVEIDRFLEVLAVSIIRAINFYESTRLKNPEESRLITSIFV